MTSLGNQILMAFIFVTIGFIGGALVALLWYERERAARKGKEEDTPGMKRKGFTLLASLWRSKEGSLEVETGSGNFPTSRVMDAVQREAMQMAAREWMDWLGMERPTQPRPSLAPAPQPELPSPPLAPVTIAEVPAPPAPQRHVDTPSIPPAIPPAKPGAKPAAAGETKPLPPASIVAQIDALLQEMLETSPLRARGIRLVEDPKEGAIVWVGMERYHGVDEVTDVEIRDFLRGVVKEWEHRAEEKTQ